MGRTFFELDISPKRQSKHFVYYLAAMSRLAKILLNKSLDECSVQEVQAITQRYPYFNAGHLLAVQKLHKEHPDQLLQSLQKANLHFRSVYINQVLSEKGNAEIIPADGLMKIETETPAPAQIESIPTDEQVNETRGQVNEINQDQPDLVIAEEEKIPVNISDDKPSENLPQIEEEITSLIPEKQDNEFDSIQSSHNDELIIPKEQVGNPKQQEPGNQSEIISSEQPSTSPEKLLRTTQSKETSSEQLGFEPYHTVDYFASQGIKVKLDENPTDKFSKQLKSFTEWLKTLKKLPDAEIASPAPAPTEQKVEQLAQTSLTETSVETEAMAEVWAKQGNHEKAIEIYHKLSLLEPTKSIYFASLIEDLKKASL